MILDKFKNKKKDKSITPSEGYKNYLKNIKIEKIKIFIMQIALLIFILGIWEMLANKELDIVFSKKVENLKLKGIKDINSFLNPTIKNTESELF